MDKELHSWPSTAAMIPVTLIIISFIASLVGTVFKTVDDTQHGWRRLKPFGWILVACYSLLMTGSLAVLWRDSARHALEERKNAELAEANAAMAKGQIIAALTNWEVVEVFLHLEPRHVTEGHHNEAYTMPFWHAAALGVESMQVRVQPWDFEPMVDFSYPAGVLSGDEEALSKFHSHEQPEEKNSASDEYGKPTSSPLVYSAGMDWAWHDFRTRKLTLADVFYRTRKGAPFALASVTLKKPCSSKELARLLSYYADKESFYAALWVKIERSAELVRKRKESQGYEGGANWRVTIPVRVSDVRHVNSEDGEGTPQPAMEGRQIEFIADFGLPFLEEDYSEEPGP